MVSVMRAIAASLSELSCVIGNFLIEKAYTTIHSPSSNTDGLDLVAWCRTPARAVTRLPGQAWPSSRTQSTSDAINVPPSQPFDLKG
jgi:hypothetical protein